MTHPDLVLRAEQAVIGEALRDRQRLDDIAYLTPDRLAHPTHRALLTALIESRTSEPAIAADRVPELIAERAAIRGVDADYLRQLADASPRSGNIATYARMVQEAAVRRDLSLHVDRARAVGAGVRGPDPLLDRVAAVMRRNELATPVARLDEPPPRRSSPVRPRPLSTRSGSRSALRSRTQCWPTFSNTRSRSGRSAAGCTPRCSMRARGGRSMRPSWLSKNVVNPLSS